MVKSNFNACLERVLRHEGTWADHPSDPGGATMKGITIGTYAQFKGRKVTKEELRAIPDSEVATIYRRKYWDVVRGDELPAGLDYTTFDAAVNSGPGRGAKWLQQAVGAPVDGKIGPATVRMANLAPPVQAIEAMHAIRAKFLRSLKTWPTFGKGWQRRIDDVRIEALRMASASPAAPSAPVTPPAAPDTPAKPQGLLAALLAALAAMFGKR